MKEDNCSSCFSTKHRSEDEKKRLNKRLATIEGQVRGVRQMIEDDRYCNDVLIQINAINSSLKSLGKSLLKGHMKTCMVEEIKKENLDVIDNVIELFNKLD